MQKKTLPLGDAIKQYYEDELLPQNFASAATGKAFNTAHKTSVTAGKWAYAILGVTLAAMVYFAGFIIHIPLPQVLVILIAMLAICIIGLKEINLLHARMKEYI